jgi:hypothetical protein
VQIKYDHQKRKYCLFVITVKISSIKTNSINVNTSPMFMLTTVFLLPLETAKYRSELKKQSGKPCFFTSKNPREKQELIKNIKPLHITMQRLWPKD